MDEKQTQRHKALGEYLRFLTTLSTGSLVLLTSFLERLGSPSRPGVDVAFIGFTVCILTSVIAYSFVTINFGATISDRAGRIMVGAMVVTWFSFISAIIALTISALNSL